MTLSVVATYSSLPEAYIAAGALRAAGFDAEVFDGNFGSVVWMDQVAIGGFRVVAPQNDQTLAASVLEAIEDAHRKEQGDPVKPELAATILAMFFGLGGFVLFGNNGAVWGWLMREIKYRETSGNPAWMGAVVLAWLLMVPALVSIGWVIWHSYLRG